MTRNRKSAKDAGTRFNTGIAKYLAKYVADHIEVRSRNGAKDRGDISGLRHMRRRIVVEAKDRGGQIFAGEWLRETEIERLNDDAGVGLVIAKRRGMADPGKQLVITTVDDLICLLTGSRPDEIVDAVVTEPGPDPWAESIDVQRYREELDQGGNTDLAGAREAEELQRVVASGPYAGAKVTMMPDA